MNQLIEAPAALSILDLPQVETEYLVQQWLRARDRFLFYVLTRKGQEPEQLRHNTAATYRLALSQFFDPVFDSYGIMIWPGVIPWETSRQAAEAWLVYLGQAGQPVKQWREIEENGKTVRRYVEVGRKGLAAASIATKLAALKEFFDYVQNGFEFRLDPALHNVFLNNDPPLLHLSENRRAVTLWSPQWRNPFASGAVSRPMVDPYGKSVEPSTEEVAEIFRQVNRATVTGLRDYALLMCLYSTACRLNEVLNLKWGDIIRTSQGYAFRFRGKSGKFETVPLQPEVYRDIVSYLEAAGRGNPEPEEYIFSAIYPERVRRLPGQENAVAENKPIHRSQVLRMIQKYARRAGVTLDKAHPHALRHAATVATAEAMKEKNGAVDILELKALLRHSSIATTQIYADKKLAEVRDPWAQGRIEAVRPGARRPGQKKVMTGQMALKIKLEE